MELHTEVSWECWNGFKKLGNQLFEEGNGGKSVDKSETSLKHGKYNAFIKEMGVSTTDSPYSIGLA